MGLNPQKIAELFKEAISRPPIDRGLYIDDSCGSDSGMRGELEAMIVAHERSAESGKSDPGATVSMFAPVIETAGAKIGRYKLLQRIGDGGGGSVFLAEQQEPVWRKVALKIIKLGMDTGQVIARFEAERQALAMMDHPNIAKVLDAGATETGRPYFVMELVNGVPITEHCDTHRLTIPERLVLFIQVCQAVQHAHQKGIIHRDIKPSNVLVTILDDRAVPKVIDFGIAKAINTRLTERTLFTEFRQFMGTPLYMSPEQAELGRRDVDTRSDVYSLGVLLYELLTGATPFDSEQMAQGGFDEIRRIIREVEPRHPSTRLQTMNESAATLAAQRHCDPRRLTRMLSGELDWIVMKCLEKDRVRRYDSASALADDVQRHLDDEPILARPGGALYRWKKILRRHRAAVLALSVAIGGLVIGLGFASYELVNARRAQRAAENLTRQVAQISGMVNVILSPGRPASAGGNPVLARASLDEAAKMVESGKLVDDPDIEAQMRHTLGTAYFGLGAYDAAEAQLRKALETARGRHGEQDPFAAIERDLAKTVGWRGDRRTAAEYDRHVLKLQDAHHGADSAEAAAAREHLAVDLAYLGGNEEAKTLVEQALAIRRRRSAAPPTADVANDTVLLGEINEALGAHTEAKSLVIEGISMQLEMLGPDRLELANSRHNLALILANEGEISRAIQEVNLALAIKRRVLPEEHPELKSSRDLLAAMINESNDYAAMEPILQFDYWLRKNRDPQDPCVDDVKAIINLYEHENKPEQVREWQARLIVPVAGQDRLSENEIIAGKLARELKVKEAADGYQHAIDTDASRNFDWYLRGCLLANSNQPQAWKAHCQKMLDRFAATPDAREADRTAKACLLLPVSWSPQDMQRISNLIETARKSSTAANDANLRGWFSLCKEIALYRQGLFSDCAVCSGEAVATPDKERAPTAELILAMADFKSQKPRASVALEQAEQRINKDFALVDGKIPETISTENWLIANTLLREAEDLTYAVSPPAAK